MVACRSRDQAAAPLLIGERADLIVGTAHLIGAGTLPVFGLEIDLSACLLAEIVRINQFRIQCHTADSLAGFLKFCQRKGLVLYLCSFPGFQILLSHLLHFFL